MDVIKKWWVIPEVTFVTQFFDHELYLKAFEERGKKYDFKQYDHVIFSFHGLPKDMLTKFMIKVFVEIMIVNMALTKLMSFAIKQVAMKLHFN